MKKFLVIISFFILAFSFFACDNTPAEEPANPTINFNQALPVVFELGAETPDWLSYVTAQDYEGKTITLTAANVDTSAVDMNRVGSFGVIFTATDSGGRTTNRTLLITITEAEVVFGNCDPNFTGEHPILDFAGGTIRYATWMRNFLDPFFPFAKQTELNEMKKTCFTRAMDEHDATIQWVSYFNDINHWNEIINGHLAGTPSSDLFNINSHYLGRLVRAGAVRPITEFVEKYMPDYYWESNTQIGTWDGEIYGFWNERHNVNMGIYVNLDLINEYSQTNPAELWQNGEWDWDAFERMAQEIKANAPADLKIFGINSYHAGSYFIGSNGGRIINPETNAFELNEPRTIRALEFMRDLTQDEYLYFAEEGDSQTRSEFVQGNMVFYFGSDWISGDPNILKPGSAVQFTLGMVPFPVGPDVTDIETEYRLPITVSNLWVVRGDATDEEAEKYVQFFVNSIPWGDDVEQDFRYYQTMEDHMDDLTSLEAYISVSRLGYYEKTFLFGIVWAEPGQAEIAPGIGNVFGAIAQGESITATIDAALPSLQARVNEALGID